MYWAEKEQTFILWAGPPITRPAHFFTGTFDVRQEQGKTKKNDGVASSFFLGTVMQFIFRRGNAESFLEGRRKFRRV